tara:strand:+ start:4520 stop:6853 length:2334 start_codon:yes stop_codon:yes gene_type:complete
MRVSICTNIYSKTPEKQSSVYKVLDLIKSDKLKSKIANLRIEDDEEKQKALKFGLPFATFAGTFTYVSKDKLDKSSGLACLDFDYLKEAGVDLEELRVTLNKDAFTFSSFISPRGNGLKLLVKIPPVDNDKQYKEYYHELQKHYDKYFKTDNSTKDISRATFLSFDPDLYINPESDLFTDRLDPVEVEKYVPVNIPITDENETVDILLKWNKKKYNGSNRNTTLHSLARSFNTYGVSQLTCENYLFQYQEKDFSEGEIRALINSAYRHTEEFNTKAFEDSKKVKKIKNFVSSGKKPSDIIKNFEELEVKGLEKEIEKHQSEQTHDVFWYFTDKEQIKLDTNKYNDYLQHHNISKYYPTEKGSFLFIKKQGNFIKEFNDERIKDFVLTDLSNRGEMEARGMCADSMKVFNRNYMNMIHTSEPKIQKDTREKAYIYYKNTAVEVTKDKFKTIPYDDLDGLVWEDQVIDRDLVLAPESDGEFKTFMWKICAEDKDRYYTMKSVVGYLLHSYQNVSSPKVIIFNDEMISDVPNGGSGKGLIHTGIGHVKKLSTINGKGFDPSTQFAYQTVDTDSQVLLFDDIDKNFKFENLFSVITEGLEIEKKGQTTVKLPIADSPKISITTNYTVQGEGGSHKRRVFEVEMSSYFNADNTPRDEFGHDLFYEWTDEEWAKFDNFMLRCVQFYLSNGLVESKTINLELRKLRNLAGADFIDWMDCQDWDGKEWYKSSLKDAFIRDYSDYAKLSTQKFNKFLSLYCELNGLVLEKKKKDNMAYISISKVPF